ncbi:molybdopterin cofactor-binding domain-containing protein [Pseudonocardia sp. SCN 73-27]|uniref:molybdopterin cofactor-binding domain-containing protein n=1 Tax=Pseudonocardia sp. SCN 73-27 TaxID=1660132 RepID=UPI0025F946D8|nr:molybdopterin cofactor-binding domain-containing protein [Pseudonocardia sp. SCN 73-27]
MHAAAARAGPAARRGRRRLDRGPGPRAGPGPATRARERGPAAAEGAAAARWQEPGGRDTRSHGGVAVEVRVDRETGALSVLRAAVVADTGRVVNSVAHRGQLEGGFVCGLSQTLIEDLCVEDGTVTTASLGDYKIASGADVPPLDVRTLPPHPTTGDLPLSVGELVNVGVAPAVANAVADATCAWVRALPITPERVLAALQATQGDTKGDRPPIVTSRCR